MSRTRGRKGVSAADLLGPLWWSQVADLRAREADLRLGREGAVRRFRGAARRLQTSVSAFGPLSDPRASEVLDEALERTVGVLGAARDAEVVQARLDLLRAAGAVAPGAADRRVEELTQHVVRQYESGWQRAVDHLNDESYDLLVRRLDLFSDLPRWTDAARLPAEEVLGGPLAREWTRFGRRGRKALGESPGPRQDLLFHRTRGAARRAGFVSDAVWPVFGRDAKRMRKAARSVRHVLGAYRDAALTASFLEEAEAQFPGAGESGSALSRLRAAEAESAAGLRAEFAEAFRAADRPSLRRWNW